MKERIRYSGCVYVRGIFRKNTWRPRHIEIDEEGIVRYFSSNSKERLDRALQLFSLPDFEGNDKHDVDETFQRSLENLPHHVHDHRPKAIMTIVCARLIDEKSIRDMNVGLPQGTYGFVFTGRKVLNAALGDNTEHFDESHHFSKILKNGEQDHFSTSRDYLCSVASLDEAEKWVKVLKWASKVAGELYCDSNDDSEDGELHDQGQNHLVLDEDDNDSVDDTSITSFNTSATKCKGGNNPSRNTMSYTIVSKVSRSKVGITKWNRVMGLNCEIFYEIKLLLLDSKKLKTRRRKRKESDESGWKLHEYTIYRSLTEIQYLIEELKSSGYNTTIVENNLYDLDSPITFPKTREKSHKKIIGKDELTVISRVIQGITSDVSMCNSVEAKRFFALFCNRMDPRMTENQCILRFIGQHLLPREMTKEVQSGKSIDDFVIEWLEIQKETKATDTDVFFVRLLLMLKNAYVEFVSTIAILYIMKQILSVLSILTQQSFQIRVDVFSIAVIGAFYEGYRLGTSKKNDYNVDFESVCDKKDIRSGAASIHNQVCDIKQDIYTDEIGEYHDKDTCFIDEPLSSPLPTHPAKHSYWSQPDDSIFRVRGASYLRDRIKNPSRASPFKCRGVDMWITDNPERNIARLPCVLGGKLGEEETFLVNFLLPFGNFVTYFTVDRTKLSNSTAKVWERFVRGDQQYRDARLKLLPIVLNGPWIVKRAVGPGSSPALLGQAIPLQYYFTPNQKNQKGIYEVDVIITASRIAKGILSVVKGHTKHLTIALGFIIEGTKEEELPETVLASCQIHSLHLERCMRLPTYWDDYSDGDDDDEIVY